MAVVEMKKEKLSLEDIMHGFAEWLDGKEALEIVEVSEISSGDKDRIAEVTAWAKEGKSDEEVRDMLLELGYNEYHATFLLRKAQGKYLTIPPQELKRRRVQARTRRVVGVSLVFLILFAGLLYFLFTLLQSGIIVQYAIDVVTSTGQGVSRIVTPPVTQPEVEPEPIVGNETGVVEPPPDVSEITPEIQLEINACVGLVAQQGRDLCLLDVASSTCEACKLIADSNINQQCLAECGG